MDYARYYWSEHPIIYASCKPERLEDKVGRVTGSRGR
jgi:hypothetical protein